MAFGVVPEGFNAKDRETIIGELEDSERGDLGPDIITTPDSLLGQLNGIMGDKFAELWEVALAVYRARQPDSAVDEALDNVAAITGAVRLPAIASSVTLNLNLDPATTVPALSVAQIGTNGETWAIQAAVENVGTDQATFQVLAKSEELGPIPGNAYSIDNISTPIGGWVANAAFNSLNSEPFLLEDLQTLLVQVDGGSTQTVIFNTADFTTIGAATAQEVIDAIVADTTDIDGADVSGFIRLFSELNGAGSSIKVVGGTAFEALGFARELIKGFNPSRSAKIVNANVETYDLSSSPTLFIAVDGAVAQTITFVDADFGVAAKGDLTAIAANLLAAGVDTDTFVLDDGVNPAVTFVFDDDASVAVSATLRDIVHNGTQTAAQMRTLIVAAINAAPTLDITASPSTASTAVVDLVNDVTGVAGNIAIVETVADASFLVSGMAGGVADAPTAATAIQTAKAINKTLTGAVAYEAAGAVQIESLVAGVNSQIEITGGSANTELGYVLSDAQGGTSGNATLGRNLETNPDFRARRDALLRIAGSATVEAIRSTILAVEGVIQAFVFENPTDITDGFGRPPHSVEGVVVGGTDVAVAQAIFDSKAAGIETFKVPGPNGVEEIITDSQGVSHTIRFSRADEIQMFVEVDIDATASIFGGGSQVLGEQQVREAIKATGDVLQIGEDVIILRFKCAPLDVAGVVDVTSIDIEDTFPPSNTLNIVILDRELATFSISDIVVNTTFV